VSRNVERQKRLHRCRHRAEWKGARREKRAREESDRAAREKKEVVVVTWNVRTLVVKRKNRLGHAEPLLLHSLLNWHVT